MLICIDMVNINDSGFRKKVCHTTPPSSIEAKQEKVHIIFLHA